MNQPPHDDATPAPAARERAPAWRWCRRCRSLVPPEARGDVDPRAELCHWCAYVDSQG